MNEHLGKIFKVIGIVVAVIGIGVGLFFFFDDNPIPLSVSVIVSLFLVSFGTVMDLLNEINESLERLIHNDDADITEAEIAATMPYSSNEDQSLISGFDVPYTLPHNLCSNNFPVSVTNCRILRESISKKIVAQCRFKNISECVVSALAISIDAFDAFGNQLEGVYDYQFLDLQVKQSQDFGSRTAIIMPNKNTRSIKIKSISVVTETGIVTIDGAELVTNS